MVLDVQQASLVADLGVAFVVDWAFLVDGVDTLEVPIHESYRRETLL